MRIQKVKTWKVLKDNQPLFEIIERSENSYPQTILRLKDNREFKRFSQYLLITSLFGIQASRVDIMSIYHNLRHVEIRLYDEDKKFLKSGWVLIDELNVL
jgi:hypothetical protein